jgi:hypothetical protein
MAAIHRVTAQQRVYAPHYIKWLSSICNHFLKISLMLYFYKINKIYAYPVASYRIIPDR